ncbi:site-specific integrase [Aliiroseovarius crassostreae]|uniref:site-specific integrase n=1 Tax=Aliiroseovarius crassostreae TaxID=154981 RepID=UPI002201CF24|nr:site-specific integrase [Aliiroseovarius crassostreae]UWP97871.1 site-specific integrase [Aliiroseovarius crassostreae]
MGITPHLVLRGTTFYFRMAVPRHLVKTVGRAEVSTSLRTVNRKEATLRCRYLSNSLDVFFQGLRMQKGPTFEEIDAEIKAYFQKALNWSLEFTEVLMDDITLKADKEAEAMPALIEDFQTQLKSGSFSQGIQNDANELLAPLLPSGGKANLGAIRHACRGIALAKIEQYRRLIGDLTGDFSNLGQGDPRFIGMAATGYPPMEGDDDQSGSETLQLISQRFRKHKQEVGDAAKTIADFDVTMRIAYEVIPAKRLIRAISDADIRGIRDLLKRMPPNALKAKAAAGKTFTELAAENEDGPYLAYATQEKRLRFFRAMLNWAAEEGYLDRVPGQKVAVAGKKQKAQTGGPYSLEDLQIIFATPVYTGRASEARAGTAGDQMIKDGKFWVPLIGLFSGMRLGEIVQLHRSDLKTVDGVWVFDINRAEDNDKKVKTDTSLRQVPVHRTLIELGLQARCDDNALGKRLFPDLRPGANGFYSHNFSKWWSRYGKSFDFRGEKKVFHSFRHLFADALRDVEAPDYVLKAILGHSDKSITANYGHGAKLSLRQSYVDRVNFDVAALNELIQRERIGGA